MHSTSPVFKIIPTAQNYDWGKVGSDSKVAQLAAASKLPGFELNETAPYAELWMGTHPTSPSHVLSSREPLSEHLKKHPDLIGQSIIQKFDASNGNLPFLFKVLSIEKALSIQTHPDKKSAEELHAKLPHIYKDANHKPEMALALTPFRALCGFLPLDQIATHLRATPEFAALIPATIVENFLSLADSSASNPSGPAAKAALKTLFEAVMTAEGGYFRSLLSQLVQRYERGEAKLIQGENQETVDLVLRLNSQFPGDIGVFCAYILNHVSLEPGGAIFLGAGEPHAYVSGDIMECMANSDNVIRAGLTPKLRDVPNLVSGLTYVAAPPSKHVVSPQPFNIENASTGGSTLYNPPIPEFSVIQIRVSPGTTESQRAIAGPSIAIVTEGINGRLRWGGHEDWEEMDIGLGDVLFIGANTETKFIGMGEGENGGEVFTVYRAFVET